MTRRPITPSAPWPLVCAVYDCCQFTGYQFTAGFFHRVTRLGRELAAICLEGQ